MSTDNFRINDQSIKSAVDHYKNDLPSAIAEYIWNSFDSNASMVNINYSFNNQVEFGYPSLEIKDNGDGWNMRDSETVSMFLDSKKRREKQKYKSLPHGSKGIGRFAFVAFASNAIWESAYGGELYTLTLSKQLKNYNTNSAKNDSGVIGTTVSFAVDNPQLDENFFEQTLKKKLLEKFAWFLALYPDKKIMLNDDAIDVQEIIAKDERQKIVVDGNEIDLWLIQWKYRLADKEYSKVYFLDKSGEEQFKQSSGLNNKSDVFYHSAYVKSDKFIGYRPCDNVEEEDQLELFPHDSEQKKFIKQTLAEVKNKLTTFRAPYIEQISHDFIQKLTEKHVMPEIVKNQISQEGFNELVRQTYVIAPEIYTGQSEKNNMLMLQLMASLVENQEGELLVKVIEGVYELTAEQKAKLLDLLDRTSLGNIVDTVSEIDHRLQTLVDLEEIIYDSAKYKQTLEVRHLQKILDSEFWVFGEQYRLVASTEGKIKDVIQSLAKEMLGIEDYMVESTSKKELDLLLSKKMVLHQTPDDTQIHNIVVELKRPSVKLGNDELNQITGYKSRLLRERVCGSPNMNWDFILVGASIDENSEIPNRIKSNANHGEEKRGLVECVHSDSQNYKIYVRTWTDIINCELRPKMQYLQDRLSIAPKDNTGKSQDDITQEHLLRG